MPIYEFYNSETAESITKLLKISEKETFLEENPHIKQIHTSAPGLVSGVNAGRKVSSGFKEVLSKVAEAHPNSALAEKVGGRSTTNSKVNQIAKKNRLRKNGSYDMPL